MLRLIQRNCQKRIDITLRPNFGGCYGTIRQSELNSSRRLPMWAQSVCFLYVSAVQGCGSRSLCYCSGFGSICKVAWDLDPNMWVRFFMYFLHYESYTCHRSGVFNSIPTDPARIMIRIWILAVDPDTEKKKLF